jgi:hypothetical protein
MPRRSAQSAHRTAETHCTRHNGEVGRNLHVGGVQVDRDRPAGQRRGKQVQHPPGHHRHATLNPFPLGAVIRRARPAAVVDAGPHPLTPPATSTYPAHQIGVLSAGLTITWQRSSSQARAAPIGIYTSVSPAYSWNRV